MIPSYVRPFGYSVPWKSRSMHFGEHRGTLRGLGDDYKDNASLQDYPDLRRMDFRQSVKDINEQIFVRTYNQNNTTPIYVVADLSSSMQFGYPKRKLDFVIEAASSIAYSAYLSGDPFGFIAYHTKVDESHSSPLSNHVFQHFISLATLSDYQNNYVNGKGILDVPYFLSGNRSIVYWISDFHMPTDLIEKALIELSGHQVIPVVLWHDKESKNLPKFGFSTLIDPETGKKVTLFFRESLRNQFIEAFESRKAELEHLFLKFEYPPLFFSDDFNPESITHYFQRYLSL